MKFLPSIILTLTTGRLYADMENMYEILSYLTGEQLMTHHLPPAANYVNPIIKPLLPEQLWEENWVHNDDTFLKDVAALDTNMAPVELEPLSKEQMKGFELYMMDNSLLLKRLDNQS